MPAAMTDHRRTTRTAVVVLAAMIASGCASDRSAGKRFSPGTNSSTVAPDRANFPRGETIPPAGFGVDLVDVKPGSGGEHVPPRLVLASHVNTAGSRP